MNDKKPSPPPSRPARPLPIVVIDGRKWFVDARLRELRSVENPHERRPM